MQYRPMFLIGVAMHLRDLIEHGVLFVFRVIGFALQDCIPVLLLLSGSVIFALLCYKCSNSVFNPNRV